MLMIRVCQKDRRGRGEVGLLKIEDIKDESSTKIDDRSRVMDNKDPLRWLKKE